MADRKEWTTHNLDVDTAASYCYEDAERNRGRAGLIHEAAELKAQVVEVAVRNGVILEFFDDGWK